MTLTDELLYTELLNAQTESIVWYKPIFDASQVLIDFEFSFCNDATVSFSGISKEIWLGQHLLQTELIDVDTRKTIFEHCAQVYKTGKEDRHVIYSGSLDKHFSVIRKKIRDGVVTFSQEVTNQVIAEEKEQKQTDFLQSILDTSLHALIAFEAIRDANGVIVDLRFTKVNKRFEELTGRREAELLQSSYLKIFPSAQEMFAFNVSVIESKQAVRKEVYYKGDGLDAWFDISTAPLGSDGLVVSFDDVSERHQNNRKIESSLHYLQTVINSSQTGITVIEPIYQEGEIVDFCYKLVNETFSRVIEKEPEELREQPLSKMFPLYKAQGTFDRYKQIYLTGVSQRFDLHYVKGGYDVWADIMAKKQGDEILVTFHDYTTLKLAQLKLEELVNTLQRSNTNLEDFAYAASHDLQEPLRKIHFFSDKLRSRYEHLYDEEGLNMFQRMEGATQRMRALIEDLLTYSQISLKPKEDEFVELDQIIQDVLTDLETLIEEKKAHFTIDPLPIIKGDKPQLRQLFQNLISNALKYAHADRMPFVSMHAQKVKGRESGFSLPAERLQEEFHLIEISDNGIGFDQGYAEKIFNVFQRLHGKNEYSGTGVGLAIVKKVIDNHRGFINASGVVDQGATFRVLLPV